MIRCPKCNSSLLRKPSFAKSVRMGAMAAGTHFLLRLGLSAVGIDYSSDAGTARKGLKEVSNTYDNSYECISCGEIFSKEG